MNIIERASTLWFRTLDHEVRRPARDQFGVLVFAVVFPVAYVVGLAVLGVSKAAEPLGIVVLGFVLVALGAGLLLLHARRVRPTPHPSDIRPERGPWIRFVCYQRLPVWGRCVVTFVPYVLAPTLVLWIIG